MTSYLISILGKSKFVHYKGNKNIYFKTRLLLYAFFFIYIKVVLVIKISIIFSINVKSCFNTRLC